MILQLREGGHPALYSSPDDDEWSEQVDLRHVARGDDVDDALSEWAPRLCRIW